MTEDEHAGIGVQDESVDTARRLLFPGKTGGSALSGSDGHSGSCTVNIEATEILTADRQQELSELTDESQDWLPDTGAVERPPGRRDDRE